MQFEKVEPDDFRSNNIFYFISKLFYDILLLV
jgi:hypothetical protein